MSSDRGKSDGAGERRGKLLTRDDRNAIRALLRLDMKSRFGHGGKIAGNAGKWILNFTVSAGMYAILVAVLCLFTKMFVVRPGLRGSYLILMSMLSVLLQIVICTAALIKSLYYTGDNEILLRFPVNAKQIFIAKSLFVLITNFFVTLAMLLPVYISYGVFTAKAGAAVSGAFYGWAVVLTAAGSFLPFFFANIIAIPVMKFLNFIKDKYLLVMITAVGAVLAVFILYMTVLQSLITFYVQKDMALFAPKTVGVINAFAAKAFPFNLYGNILLGRDAWLSALYLLLLTAGTGAVSYAIVRKWYFKTILDGVEKQRASFTKVTGYTVLPPFLSFMRREFYGIVRSFNYSFQYIVMALCAPVMVYYCNSLAGTMGRDSVGDNILPGISIMVITIFVTLIVSFASTAVSREGPCFYHTKTIPLSYGKQLAAKFLLYSGVATASTALCAAAIAKFVPPAITAMIFFVAEFSNIALTSLCMWFDTLSPSFNFTGDGEIAGANKNVAIALVAGLLFAVCCGILTMIGGFLPYFAGVHIRNGVKTVLGFLLGVSGALAAAGLFLLFFRLRGRYEKIGQ